MKLKTLFTILACAMLMAGCKKEPFDGTDLVGNWTSSHYTYLYWGTAIDSTTSYMKEISAPVYMNITSGSTTEFLYGSGTANLPLTLFTDANSSYQNTEPTMTEGQFLIEDAGSTASYANNNDYFLGTVKFGADFLSNATCEFKLITANKLNVKVLLRQTTGDTHKYTYAFLELTK